jgi:hypothetical protein
MVDIVVSISGGVVCLGIGSYLLLRSAAVSEKLRSFSSTYPLIRLAGEKQHTARNSFVKLLGAVFIILGIVMLFEIALQILR